MDFHFTVCIAWFCRSTRPFKTFRVSINDQLGWFWPNLLLYYTWIAQTTVSYPRTGVEHRVFRFSQAPCCLFHHTNNVLFHGISLILDNPTSTVFPVWNLICPAKKVVKTTVGKLSHLQVSKPVSYSSPLTLPIPSPYMGSSVGVLCTWYR